MMLMAQQFHTKLTIEVEEELVRRHVGVVGNYWEQLAHSCLVGLKDNRCWLEVEAVDNYCSIVGGEDS